VALTISMYCRLDNSLHPVGGYTGGSARTVSLYAATYCVVCWDENRLGRSQCNPTNVESCGEVLFANEGLNNPKSNHRSDEGNESPEPNNSKSVALSSFWLSVSCISWPFPSSRHSFSSFVSFFSPYLRPCSLVRIIFS
jgi:hypothetical protein